MRLWYLKKLTKTTMEIVSDLQDLQYLFDKYIESTRRGKPNKKGLKQLLLALEAHEIYLVASNIASPPNN